MYEIECQNDVKKIIHVNKICKSETLLDDLMHETKNKTQVANRLNEIR